jgi:hypothetical protein
MRWEVIRARWEEFIAEACDAWSELSYEELRSVGGDRTLFVAVVRRRLGVTEEAAESSIEAWAQDIQDLDDEPVDEAARHAGRDDVHEQRESDQNYEGLLHWPPHLGLVHARPRHVGGR